jgi:hypothetical protein
MAHSVDWTSYDWTSYEQLKAQGISERKIAEQLNIPRSTFRREIAKRVGVPAVHHSAPPTALQPTEPSSALPVHPSTPVLQDHETRLAVLEAFMSSLQADHRFSALISAPEYTSAPIVHYSVPSVRDWKKTGAEFATDTHEAIKQYAQAHGLQVREVVDLALRRFLAQVGEEVRRE